MTTPTDIASTHRALPRIATPAPATPARAPRVIVTARSREHACASLAARLGAGVTDLFIYLAVLPFALGLGAVLLRDLWPLAAAGLAVCYLAIGWSEGQTFGMRVAGTRLVRVRDGCAPGFERALARALIAAPPACALAVLANAPLDGAPASMPALAACLALAAVGVVDNAWPLWDRHGRALHDHLTGAALVAARVRRR